MASAALLAETEVVPAMASAALLVATWAVSAMASAALLAATGVALTYAHFLAAAAAAPGSGALRSDLVASLSSRLELHLARATSVPQVTSGAAQSTLLDTATAAAAAG